uniref:Uncharacterized protein n=1 Tax=Caenorhabditis japonica TaxID=281687 RepID=A0A8R1E6X7_CAEJA
MFAESQQGMKSSFAEALSMGGRVPTVSGPVANRLFGDGRQASDAPRRRPLRSFPPTTHPAFTFSSQIAS